MSLKARDVTQGGQVTFMRMRMFLEINNIISYWAIILLALLTVGSLLMRMSMQNIKNGAMYWWVKSLHPMMRHMAHEPTYQLDYYGKTLNYTGTQILSDAYTTYCGTMLIQELVISALIGFAIISAGGMLFYWYLGHTGKKQSQDEILGGRVLSEDPKAVAGMMKKQGKASDIKVDALPIVKDSEIQNFAMHGTVGSGKSQLIRKFLEQCRARGDLVIIYDKGCTFVREFYDEKTDIILNPYDTRCANWDMWAECPTLSDLETVANTLIPMGASEDPFWQGSARTIFAEGTHRLRNDKDRSYNKLLRTLLAINLDQLRQFLAGTPASTLVDGKIEKTAISIRSVLTNYVKAMRYLQGIEKSGKPAFTIREWMKGVKDGEKNGWLFITSNQRHHESLKPVISMWLSIAANSLMSMGENRHRRVWFWYDELKSLHKLPGLPEIMAEARKFGGCFGLGFQSYPQLEEVYGHQAAEGMFDLLNTKFFFRSPSAGVAQFVEKELGETVRLKFSEQTSFGNDKVRDGLSSGKDEERVPVVSYSDVQNLPDLACFITLPGAYPVVKMQLKYVSRPDVAEEFIEREVQDSLDEIIEKELEVRDNDSALFNGLFTATSTVAVPAEAMPAPVQKAAIPPANPAVTPLAEQPQKISALPAETSPPPVADEVKKPARKKAAPAKTRKDAGATAAATEGAVAESTGGREDELLMDRPDGVTEDGEIVDENAYAAYLDMLGGDEEMNNVTVSRVPRTQDAVRREEVNINHSRQDRESKGMDMEDYLP
ncbi:type IV conjugative transfer system coupling protein TraD [Chimaeribacter arupi]|uniref:type IV conjugative transfer system coupling protein TraD n=1 Tax=Chimaeribacter arupi TaxID=2060066 RepID=UPI000C7BB1E4|nr:type IV conjugative transfer system coupling protein TraD [Chimaeribacter arupi]PLR30064.1 type IV conjugative transfer system coupling protein TraD [Chimaeribacter arupi]